MIPRKWEEETEIAAAHAVPAPGVVKERRPIFLLYRLEGLSTKSKLEMQLVFDSGKIPTYIFLAVTLSRLDIR